MIEFPQTAATARPAATVMLARPIPDAAQAQERTSEDYEIFMLRRSARSAFVPDVYVFPGGGLDAGDSSPEAHTVAAGFAVAEAVARLRDAGSDANVVRDPSPAPPLDAAQTWGLFFACARELFEEAAVLLTAPGVTLHPDNDTDWLLERRAALNRHETTLVQILREANVTLDLSRLIYFSRWITPAAEPRRYDTRFFFAALTEGEGEQAAADEKETTAGIWIAPSVALARYAAGDFGLIYPTIEHLKRLSAHPTLTDATAYARNKDVIAVSPDVWSFDGGKRHEFKLQPVVNDTW